MLYKKVLFIFRRDLRLQDNTALTEAVKNAETVFPCFIIDPRQAKEHPYRSAFGLTFLAESLLDLEEQIQSAGGKISFLEGDAEECIEALLKKKQFDAVYFNEDYTPFSRKRDDAIRKICKKHDIECITFHDALLTAPGTVLKKDGNPYTVFTPFSRTAKTQKIQKPIRIRPQNFAKTSLPGAKPLKSLLKWKTHKNAAIHGGREHALKLLRSLDKQKQYEKTRDIPALDATSHLSAHHKFGTISVRETAHAIKEHLSPRSSLLTELYWRDFFTHIAWFFPHVFKGAFHKKYDKIDWKGSSSLLKKWEEGKTGFPIVDAGMRELKETGFMHNRVRMITASFLVKDLLIDWRKGEKHFASLLVDYDPAVNNGSWQWAASTGCDAQPYFRIFNPWLQQKKFDPECLYIKKWIPELETCTPKEIHSWERAQIKGINYPKPCIEHKKQSQIAKSLFKKV